MKTLIIGFGAVARGYIAPLFKENKLDPIFCLSQERWNQYEKNSSKEYKILRIAPDWKTVTEETYNAIETIPCYNGENASREILQNSKNTQLILTAVGASNLPSITPLIKEIIRERAKQGTEQYLNILLIENLTLSCKEVNTLEETLMHDLGKYYDYFKNYIGIVDTLTEITCVSKKNLDVISDNNLDIYINKNRLKGNLPLTSCQIHLENDIEPMRARKLFIQNFIDTAAAYLGAKYDYDKIHKVMNDSRALIIIEGALEEIKKALSLKYFSHQELTTSKLEDYAEKQKLRIKCPLMEDTVERIAREPRRKLGKDERLLGAALLSVEMGIPPVNILECAKAAAEYWRRKINITKPREG